MKFWPGSIGSCETNRHRRRFERKYAANCRRYSICFAPTRTCLRRLITLISTFIHEAQSDPDHALRHDFDRFVTDFVEKLDTSPEYADRAETLKRELLARPEIRDLAEDLWQSVKRFLEKDARSNNSILEFHLGRFLTDLGRKLAHEPRLRAEINTGMVKVLQTFVQNQKREIARFITDQVRSWDIDQMVEYH